MDVRLEDAMKKKTIIRQYAEDNSSFHCEAPIWASDFYSQKKKFSKQMGNQEYLHADLKEIFKPNRIIPAGQVLMLAGGLITFLIYFLYFFVCGACLWQIQQISYEFVIVGGTFGR